jgi:hypothetical protein
MSVPAAIVLAGGLIAAAILLTSHWSVTGFGGGTVLLNRWTGEVVWCSISTPHTPAAFDCTVKK